MSSSVASLEADLADADLSNRVAVKETARGSCIPVRTIFISDLHLGNRFSRADEVLAFLNSHRPEYLYLVGDFIDAWALRKQWHWSGVYTALFNRLAELVDSGTRVFYTPGNHDDYLRQHETDQLPLRVRDQFIHRGVDGRRMVVLHGDQFDDVERGAGWLSHWGASLYESLLCIDRKINQRLITLGLRQRRISATLKQTTKKVVQYFSGFEDRLLNHARMTDSDVIICGHIHVPSYRMLEDVLYVNLGDWIENSTALVEYVDGRLELLQVPRLPETARLSAHGLSTPDTAFTNLTPLAQRLSDQLLGLLLHSEEQTNTLQCDPASALTPP